MNARDVIGVGAERGSVRAGEFDLRGTRAGDSSREIAPRQPCGHLTDRSTGRFHDRTSRTFQALSTDQKTYQRTLAHERRPS